MSAYSENVIVFDGKISYSKLSYSKQSQIILEF